MIVAATLTAVVVLLIAGVVTWTARMLHVGNLDYSALKEKIATPEPVSALDWPEVHVRAVVPQPDEPSVVPLLVDWPARKEKAATLERVHATLVAEDPLPRQLT